MLGRFGKSILKYWYSFVLGIISLADLLWSHFSGAKTTVIPTWLFWIFIIGGIFAASILAYHDLYNDKVTEVERKIRIRERSKYLPYIIPTLTRMNTILDNMVSQVSIDTIDKDKLRNAEQYYENKIVELNINIYSPKTQVKMMELARAEGLNRHNMGIRNLQKAKPKLWKNIETKMRLLHNKTSGKLSDDISKYLERLYFVYDHRLYKQYFGELDGYSCNIYANRELNKIMSRISKHIEKLSTGS